MSFLQNMTNGQIAGLNAGAGLIGSLVNVGFGAYQNARNREFQQQANEQNIAFQREVNQQNIDEQWKMWNATNDYNHPAAQMARYREAGLNPNLIYGQSNTAQANNVGTASATKVEAKRNEKLQLMSDASLYMDLLMKAEDIHSKRIENDVNGAIADDLKAQAGWSTKIIERELEKIGIEISRGNIDNAIREFDKVLRENDVNNIEFNNKLLKNNVAISDNSVSNLRLNNAILYNTKLLSDYEVNNAEYYKKYKRPLEHQYLSNMITEQMRQMSRNLRDYPVSHSLLKNQNRIATHKSSSASYISDLLGGASNLIPWLLFFKSNKLKSIKGFRSY